MIHYLLQRLVWVLVKTLISTYRFQRLGPDNKASVRQINPRGSFIFALWHEDAVAVLSAHAWTEPYLGLASRSKDGDYAAFISKKLGFIPVRGSSKKKGIDKGGKEAIKEFVEKLLDGTSGGVTVDGPKGPRQSCKAGVALMAQQSGAPILPTVALAQDYWEFNSWDRFKLPKPFTKIFLAYGPPIAVAADSGPEEIELACRKVEQALKQLRIDLKSSIDKKLT
jgi:lysophospholipid acyltransferase (LPLAT)-like uncharacterized protein